MIGPARVSLTALIVALAAACVGPSDNPSHVKDLRVLGLAFEPPELMSPICDLSQESLLSFTARVTFSALIADPAGRGRDLAYEVLACADPGDRTCSTVDDKVLLARGTFHAGENAIELAPGATLTPRGESLLRRVVETDPYRGLGGIRMPVVLHLRAETEEIYAQKLMVFSCRRFPQMHPGRNPHLRGIRLDRQMLLEETVLQVQGQGDLRLQPDDFSGLQETYYVPDFSLSPVELRESWKISWYTDFGTISPTVTGGADFGGIESRHLAQWKHETSAARDVSFWFVVRNGRGGESWLLRHVHYNP